MDKGTENAIENALGDLGVSLDELKEEVKSQKGGFNNFAEALFKKLDSIEEKMEEAIDVKKRIEHHDREIEFIKKKLNIV